MKAYTGVVIRAFGHMLIKFYFTFDNHPKISSESLSSYVFTFMLLCIVMDLFLINQQDAPIIKMYSVVEIYMFWASSLPTIRSFLLYIRH